MASMVRLVEEMSQEQEKVLSLLDRVADIEAELHKRGMLSHG